MDEDHLAAALRYVSLNPVRARLVGRARDWRWSSVHAQLACLDTASRRGRRFSNVIPISWHFWMKRRRTA